MKPEDLRTVVLVALAAELHALDTDLNPARLDRAELYLSWLRGEQ